MATLDMLFVLASVAKFLSAREYKCTLKQISRAVNKFNEDAFVVHKLPHGVHVSELGTLEPTTLIAQYREGLRHGMGHVWWRNNGKLLMECVYLSGRTVSYTTWRSDGTLDAKLSTVNGTDGGSRRVLLCYYDNGRLRSVSSTKNGHSHGMHCNWYDTGQIRYVCNWIDGINARPSRTWDQNGLPE